MHCSDNWKKSENVTTEMSDLYIWKTNLFNTNIGDLIMSLKRSKIDGQFHFLLKEMIYLKYGYCTFLCCFLPVTHFFWPLPSQI